MRKTQGQGVDPNLTLVDPNLTLMPTKYLVTTIALPRPYPLSARGRGEP